MEAKFFTILAIAIAAACASDSDQTDYSTVVPRQDIPGFWDGRFIQPVFNKFYHKFDRDARIVGGSETQPNAHPYQAGLFIMLPWGTGLCGGSLISANLVITAAHCTENSHSIQVVLGAHRIFVTSEPTQVRLAVLAADYILHPEYDPRMFFNDIALLPLPRSVEFSDVIHSIKLPDIELIKKDFAGQIATVSGENPCERFEIAQFLNVCKEHFMSSGK